MRRLPALAVALSLTATGLVSVAPTGTAATRQAPTAASTIRWHACKDPLLADFKVQCGFVKVPMDYAKPRGRKIKLAVSRVKHTVRRSKYQGVMLVNPGGPGASGVSFAALGPIISLGFGRKDVGGAYDWIGFDPRGVGSSVPSLSCDPDYFGSDRPEYVPDSPHLLNVWKMRSKRYAKACGKDGGRLLEHMRTEDAARDMDRIRKALGKKQINYYGYSYGTYLAQVYTLLFPSRVRRMVLDSSVDPRTVWYDANLKQDIAFQRNFKIFLSWIARHDTAYHLGRTRPAVAKRYRAVKNQLARAPLGGIVGPDEWDDAMLPAGYVQFLWPDLANAFASWVNKGDGAAVIQAYQSADTPGDDNTFAVYNAVSCTDGTWKNRDFLGDQWRTFYKAPLITWLNAWFNGPCYSWTAKASAPTKITGAGVGRALLVDETLDAATPYDGSVYLRKIFRKSRLIAVPGGTSHAVSPSGNDCVDNKIFAYLKTGKLPKRKAGGGADVRCTAMSKPQPNATPPAFGAWSSRQTLARAARDGNAEAGRQLIARLLLRANRY